MLKAVGRDLETRAGGGGLTVSPGGGFSGILQPRLQPRPSSQHVASTPSPSDRWGCQ